MHVQLQENRYFKGLLNIQHDEYHKQRFETISHVNQHN